MDYVYRKYNGEKMGLKETRIRLIKLLDDGEQLIRQDAADLIKLIDARLGIPTILKCKNCGKSYTGRRRDSKYHNTPCRQKAYYQRKKCLNT